MLEHAKEALQIEADSIMALIPRLDEHVTVALQMILACHGRVVLTGMGKSGLVAKKIAATFASTGTPALFLHPAESLIPPAVVRTIDKDKGRRRNKGLVITGNRQLILQRLRNVRHHETQGLGLVKGHQNHMIEHAVRFKDCR